MTGFRTKTFGWQLPRLPLQWATSPDDISTWQALAPDYYVPFIVKALIQGKLEAEPELPKEKNSYEQYPRLVRVMNANDSSTNGRAISPQRFLEVPVTQGIYNEFIGVIPDFYEVDKNKNLDPDKLKEKKNIQNLIEIPCQIILDSAENLGMLLHPHYGDSLFGWVSTILQFQLIAHWDKAIRTRTLGHGDHYFDKQFQQINECWKRTVVRVENCHDPNSPAVEFHADRISLPCTKLEMEDESENSKVLENRIRDWLLREIKRALDTYGHSEAHFTFQYFIGNEPVHGNVLPDDRSNSSEKGRLEPFFSLKSGLYAFLLYAQLHELDSDLKMEVCDGCGRPFLPRHGNQKYCLDSEGKSDVCRKRAERQTKAQEKKQPPDNEIKPENIICYHCGSTKIVKDGTSASGKQRYLCKDCKKVSLYRLK